ncbi:hypothetical protein OAF16_01005 [Flavobacteriales bacterium]|nr:hypothetical protein [Flavobacteriales bacterium]
MKKINFYGAVIMSLLMLNANLFSQTFTDTIAFDKMEDFNWKGDWWTKSGNVGYGSNLSYSSPSSAYIYGKGKNKSKVVYNWYSLPEIDSLDSTLVYKFKFHLCSPRVTADGLTSGVDANDFLEVQVSCNGQAFAGELQVQGNSNAYWEFNSSKVSKSVDGELVAYGPSGGGDRTLMGDGISVVELIFPLGTTSIAVDIYVELNSYGEEWWMDDFLLLTEDEKPIVFQAGETK